jgi:hypothetical protein
LPGTSLRPGQLCLPAERRLPAPRPPPPLPRTVLAGPGHPARRPRTCFLPGARDQQPGRSSPPRSDLTSPPRLQPALGLTMAAALPQRCRLRLSGPAGRAQGRPAGQRSKDVDSACAKPLWACALPRSRGRSHAVTHTDGVGQKAELAWAEPASGSERGTWGWGRGMEGLSPSLALQLPTLVVVLFPPLI